MPVVDAARLGGERPELKCDVCIVGAGAAGIYLGVRLASSGLSVIVLEAGGHVCERAASVGFDTDFADEVYRGALEGRSFGLGGTTARWGGVLVPYSRYDLRSSKEDGFDAWQHIVRVVQQQSRTVLENLRLRPPLDVERLVSTHLGEQATVLHSVGLEAQIAQYLPFRRKNLATLLDDFADRSENLRVVLNAVASGWEQSIDADGCSRVSSVSARCGDGRVQVSAESFVIAAGALESARILLEMNRQADFQLLRRGAAVGHYLGDHLSCPIARVKPHGRDRAADLFRPRFFGGRMFYFRLVEGSRLQGTPRSFSHFIFENESPGFELAKKVLGGVQARKLPDISPGEVIDGLKGLVALGWNRIVRSQLHIPSDTPARLQLDIEQAPSQRNRITLSDRETDAHGRPIPVIKWDLREEDKKNIRETAERVLASWPGSESGLPDLEPVLDTHAERKPHDAYHPVGVCRLGEDREAVVDPGLRVHGTQNLSVVSTAVFPSAGTANPTFSMLCMAEMLSERLVKTVEHS